MDSSQNHLEGRSKELLIKAEAQGDKAAIPTKPSNKDTVAITLLGPASLCCLQGTGSQTTSFKGGTKKWQLLDIRVRCEAGHQAEMSKQMAQNWA